MTAPSALLLKDIPPGAPIEPGHYATSVFIVPMEMDVGESWANGGGELEDTAAMVGPGQSATLSLLAPKPNTLFDPTDPKYVKTVEVAPEELLTFLHDHPAYSSSAITKTTVGGRNAQTFTFKVIDEKALTDTTRCPPPGKCIPLGTLSDGEEYGSLPGESGRVYSVDGPPQKFLISYSSEGEVTPEHTERSEQVIDSVTFTD